jgi:hypothetical protein
MAAYVVKHLVAKHGPLSKSMKEVKKTPYSYTSKEPEASDAARGADVYVVEVHVEKSKRTYWLGYKYRAHEKVAPAGGGLWKGEFKFKNSASWGVPAVGVYFEPPVRIDDHAACEWLAEKQPGMAAAPATVVSALQSLIVNPTNGARPFI